MFSKKLFGVGMTVVGGVMYANKLHSAAQSASFLDPSSWTAVSSYYGLGRGVRKLTIFKSGSNDFSSSKGFPIRNPHFKLSPAFDENLKDWAEDTTRKFQSLDFTPDDLAVEVAFLRLLGATSISLEDLGRERGSTHCFIRRIPVIEKAEPILTLTLEDVLNTIEEFRPNSQQHLRSLYPTVSDPVAHIKPAVVESVTLSIDSHALEDLYTKMSDLSDGDIVNMVKHYLGDECSAQQKALLATTLRNARKVCQEYIASLDHQQNYGNTPSKR